MTRSILVIAVVLLAVPVRPAAAQNTVQLPCTTDADCDTVGSTCVSGSCSCPPGEVVTSTLTQCLKGATGWGDDCHDAVQCVPRMLVGGACLPVKTLSSAYRAEAEDKLACQCADGYHYLQGQCWKSSGLAEPCRRSENCFVSHDPEAAVCSGDGQCACAPGFYQLEYSSCRRISLAYGEECGIMQDCQYPDSDCVDRQCSCQQGYAYDSNTKMCVAQTSAKFVRGTNHPHEDLYAMSGAAVRALLASVVGTKRTTDGVVSATAECSSASDCGPHSSCAGGQCVCDRGYFRQSDSSTTCRPEIHAACGSNSDCTVKYAICRQVSGSGICSCRGGYVPSDDMKLCRKMSRTLDWSCLHDEQCGYFGPGGRCVNKRCRCATGTHWVESQQYCWISKGVGEQCQDAEDCSGLGEADCSQGRCTCKTGFHASTAGSCRPNAEGVGAACDQNEDCVTAHTGCLAGACACVNGYITDGSGKACQPGVGGPCSTDADCGAKGSFCSRSVCSCPQDTVSSLAGDVCLQEVATLNGTCLETAQCEKLNALCDNEQCTCESNQHFRDGRCQRLRELGDSCISTSECYLQQDSDRSECRNSVCKCLYQFQRTADGRLCSSSGGRATLALFLPLLGFLLVLDASDYSVMRRFS